MSYLHGHGTRRVPQWFPLPGQIANSAGGHAFPVDPWTQLRRFLGLGSEGGSYYARELALTRENALAGEGWGKADGLRAGPRIHPRPRGGRAAPHAPAAFRPR